MTTDAISRGPSKRTLKEVVSAAFVQSDEPPLLAAAELLMQTCLKAALLYPEWAESMTLACSENLDDFARRLVARSGLVPVTTSP